MVCVAGCWDAAWSSRPGRAQRTKIPANTREDLGATALVLTEEEMERVGKAGERAVAARGTR